MADLDELLAEAEETLEKGGDLSKIDNDRHGKDRSKVPGQKSKVDEQIKQAKIEANKESQSGEEVESVEETETSEKSGKTKKAKKTRKGKAKVRSARYKQASELVEANKKYTISDAIELAKKTSSTKFDGNIEVHIRVQGKSGKPENLRGMISYPHSTGKSLKVEILDEKIIEEIASTGRADADLYLTTPSEMSKVAKLARILGPKGKMPNPKSGTITLDPVKTKAELEGGKTEYKTDSFGIVHQVIGKVSADEKSLAANYQALISSLPKERITSINLMATMGPSVKVQK